MKKLILLGLGMLICSGAIGMENKPAAANKKDTSNPAAANQSKSAQPKESLFARAFACCCGKTEKK